MLVSILIPVYNEESLICELLSRVLAIELGEELEKEVVIVNDGSSDQTCARIEECIGQHTGTPITYLLHAHNQGKGAAVRTALGAARGQILIIQDADLEYDPNEILDVIGPIVEGRHRVVYGSRILKEKALGRSGLCGLVTGKHPHSYVLAYLGGLAITKSVNFITGAKLTDEPTCYKAFHRSVLEPLQIESNDFAWEPEITMKILTSGIPIHEVPVSYHPRRNADGKKINWRDGLKALWTVWKFR